MDKWYPLTDEEFDDLIHRVHYGDDGLAPPYKVQPEDETDAMKLVIAKWHPNRGSEVGKSEELNIFRSCGACAHYVFCADCPLSPISGNNCCAIAFDRACKRLDELNGKISP